MCFSAEASFAASGVLTASSIAIARLPKDRSSVPLSLFPAVFAAHQFIEGVVWLTQDGVLPRSLETASATAYALIAYVLWPILVPYSALRMEADRRRRRVMLFCQAAGLWAGLACLVSFFRAPLGVVADCCSLSYQVDAPDLLTLPYMLAVALPFLVSSRKSLVIFGVAVTLSSVAAAVTAPLASFPSVWCFFAAALSAGLYAYFYAAARATAGVIGTAPSSRAVTA